MVNKAQEGESLRLLLATPCRDKLDQPRLIFVERQAKTASSLLESDVSTLTYCYVSISYYYVAIGGFSAT